MVEENNIREQGRNYLKVKDEYWRMNNPSLILMNPKFILTEIWVETEDWK